MSAPSREEWEAVAARFGVGIDQIRRDHLISHVLAAIARAVPTDDLIFFGGTALSRTHLTHRRSEDIDLIAVGPRREVVDRLLDGVATGLARSHGQVAWSPALDRTSDSTSSLLSVPDGTTVRVQLLTSTRYPAWPTEVVDLEQRYRDAPLARLRVPTADGFVAAKLAAWLNRAAPPRDLYDLWALSDAGLIGPSAVATFARHGHANLPLELSVFNRPVDEIQWQRSLGHQTRLGIIAREALTAVSEAWAGSHP